MSTLTYEFLVTLAAFSIPTVGMFTVLFWHHSATQEEE